jgi:hypothetical protein
VGHAGRQACSRHNVKGEEEVGCQHASTPGVVKHSAAGPTPGLPLTMFDRGSSKPCGCAGHWRGRGVGSPKGTFALMFLERFMKNVASSEAQAIGTDSAARGRWWGAGWGGVRLGRRASGL